MSTADELLRAGDVDGARAALIEVVRAKPSDHTARMFLFQLLCVLGEWDKAKSQLAILAQLSPEAQMLAVAYGQAIEAEQFRAEVFAGRATPPNLSRQSPWADELALSIGHFAAGRLSEAEEARAKAFEAAPDTPGELDGIAFEWIADADHRLGPCLEAIIAGSYGILPFDAVETVTSEGPQDLRDLVWYPAQITFRQGHSVAGMLPARYPGSELSRDGSVLLGRTTLWNDFPGGEQGQGQRLLSLSGGEDRGLLELRRLAFS